MSLGLEFPLPKASNRPPPSGARLRWLLCGVILILLAAQAWAQGNAASRIFKVSDGLSDSHCSSVSIGLNGNVWVKHGVNDGISCLTGYDILNYTSIGDANSRLLENRLGQVWTIYPNGLARMRNGHWERFPNADIEREYRTNSMRRLVNPVPFLPVYSQIVLVALPDRLLGFDSSLPGNVVLKNASATALGTFTGLAAGAEDSIWISGTQGIARFRMSPAKTISAWEDLPAPPGLANFQHPSVDDQGGVVCVAEKSEGSGKASVIAYWSNGSWVLHKLLPGRMHHAWVGPENRLWACTFRNLGWLDVQHGNTGELEAPITGYINDVATDSKGVFWLATSEGLIRYAPAAWRTPVDAGSETRAIFGLAQDSQKRLWAASDSGLIRYSRGQWNQYPLADGMDAGLEPASGLFPLPNGEVALKRGNKLFLFDPTLEQFRLASHPQQRTVKLLGQMRDGSLCVQTSDREPSPVARPPFQLETYDGQEFKLLIDTNNTRLIKGELFCSLETTNHDLWIGGSQGINLWRNDKMVVFNRADGINPEPVFCLLEMGNGRLWCGGLTKIYEYDQQHWALLESGFDRVNSLLRAQDGMIWAASNDGVYRYLSGSWLLNNTEEGLPSSAVYDLIQDDKGTLWAGTARGLSRWHPDADIDPPRVTIVSQSGQTQFSQETPITLLLQGNDKWKYTPAGRLLYSTRLDGEKWTAYHPHTIIPLKESIPGKHRFEARVMDRNGNIDTITPAILEFAVILPWYLETRLILIVSAGILACLILASVAINRHLQLKRSYAQVESIVKQRTQELSQAHEALLHSQKMQALGVLSAGIAHDFNNILSIIKGSVQIIEEHLDNKGRVLNRLDRIKTVVDQGASVVKALLGYSRAKVGEMAPCDINSVVEATIQLLGDRFLGSIALNRQLQPDLPPVRCLKDLLQQMLLNLILNASEAMAGEGKITLETRLAREFPTGGVLAPQRADAYLVLTVQDAGCGINAEIRSRIFEPFFTTKALSTRRGTGLGLSMVYEFARTQGFGLFFESEVGRGTAFSIYMPTEAPPPNANPE